MATPEQNTLLALQLFSPIAEQIAAQGAARNATLMKLTQANREEKLRRDLATQGYDKSIELARMQADRQDKLAAAVNEREDTRLRGLQTREDTRATAADTKQLRNAIAATYPKYAAEATRLGETVRKIDDFAETWEGLGDLQAEMARLEQTRVQRDQTAAAGAAVGELDDATKTVAESKRALDGLMKPTPEDEKFARARAHEAVRRSIEMGEIAGAPKANSAAATKGLAALARGDVAEASSLLGAEVLGQFDAAYQTAMQAAPNFKSRMQQVTVAQQNFQQAQRNLATIQSDLRRAAAGNNALATQLTSRRTSLQQLMAPDEGTAPPPRRRSFEELTPAPGAPAPSSAPRAQPPSGTSAPNPFAPPVTPNLFNLMMPVGGPGRTATPGSIPAPVPAGAPAPAPLTALQGGSYPYFQGTTGNADVDVMLDRPIDATYNRMAGLYENTQVDPAVYRSRVLEALMQVLHGGEFSTTGERAYGRNRIQELIGAPAN